MLIYNDLGITTYSYMETLIGKGTHERTPELQKLIDDGTYYLTQAVDIHGDQGGLEVRKCVLVLYTFVGYAERATVRSTFRCCHRTRMFEVEHEIRSSSPEKGGSFLRFQF